MSPVIIGLLFLACGWKFYKDVIYTRYIALKNSGHPQYFGGALCAVLIFLVSYSIDALLLRIDLYRQISATLLATMPVFAESKDVSAVHNFSRIFAWAIPSTYALVRLFNLPFHKSPSLILAAAKKTRIVDELEETIYFCLRAQPMLSIAITTKSKKVYIGSPKRHSPDPDRDRVWLTIWPLASGYRDEKGELILTTFYRDVRESGKGSRVAHDYQVVIPLAEIAIAQAFDLKEYAIYQQKKAEMQRLQSDTAGLMRSVSGRISITNLGSLGSTVRLGQPAEVSAHHAQLKGLSDTIVTPRERYSLRMNSYYMVLMVSAIVIAPFYVWTALAFLALCWLACYESIDPILVRIDKWKKRRASRMVPIRENVRASSPPRKSAAAAAAAIVAGDEKPSPPPATPTPPAPAPTPAPAPRPGPRPPPGPGPGPASTKAAPSESAILPSDTPISTAPGNGDPSTQNE